MRSAGAL